MHLRLGTLTSIKFQEDQLNCHCQRILVTLQELYGLNMGRLHKLDLSCAATIKNNTVEHMKDVLWRNKINTTHCWTNRPSLNWNLGTSTKFHQAETKLLPSYFCTTKTDFLQHFSWWSAAFIRTDFGFWLSVSKLFQTSLSRNSDERNLLLVA